MTFFVELELKHLKHYPHFDNHLSLDAANALVNDPNAVARHAFLPFLEYDKRVRKFRPKGQPKKDKNRPIKYAARRDAAIYSAYRNRIAKHYEEELRNNNISDCVLAYRKIPKTNGAGGKSNIEHAHEAVIEIQEKGDCVALKLDISKFFEHIDHRLLKKSWCRVLGVETLPIDHYKVFKAVTRYSVAQRDEVYERLGYIREICYGDGSAIYVPDAKGKTQLCEMSEFREKIACKGKDSSLPTLIKVNKKPYGIPQGSPISDVLANIYLFEFDIEMSDYAKSLGGSYRRYSDDILLIIPGGAEAGSSARTYVQNSIRNHGEMLSIKDEKTSWVAYRKENNRQIAFSVDSETRGAGLEYLGFRFDGHRMWLRQSTVSSYQRKVTRLLKRAAYSAVKRYPNKSIHDIRASIDWQSLENKIGRIENFSHYSSGEEETRTFWSYAKRAEKCFGPKLGSKILSQLKYRDLMHKKVDGYIDRYRRRLNGANHALSYMG